jgi:hypothetical protein
MISEIARRVREAANGGQKIANVHYLVLVNAEQLKGLDAVAFCKDIGVPETYATEFRKMISLARLMREQGARILAN